MAETQRVAIVTGAAGGIGKAMMRACWQQASRSPVSIAIASLWKHLLQPRVNREGGRTPHDPDGSD